MRLVGIANLGMSVVAVLAWMTREALVGDSEFAAVWDVAAFGIFWTYFIGTPILGVIALRDPRRSEADVVRLVNWGLMMIWLFTALYLSTLVF